MNPPALVARSIGAAIMVVLLMPAIAGAQEDDLAAINRQLAAIKSVDTEIRLPAIYSVRATAVASKKPQVKLAALSLLQEPVGSNLDQVRIPALYAIADIANSTDDVDVKRNALTALAEPLKAGQVPIRIAAIDTLNLIMGRPVATKQLLLTALEMLSGPVDSGNNAVRMPAINAIVRIVEGAGDDAASMKALDLLALPMASVTTEVRFMAIDAVERIGVGTSSKAIKERAITVLTAAKRSNWSRALVERAYAAEFKIRSSMSRDAL